LRDWLVIAIGVGFLLSILPNIYAQENISSPLKQFESGIPVQDVKCRDGFVLIIKANGEPTCVKPTSVSRLLSHGWITPDKFQSMSLYPPTKVRNGTVNPVGTVIVRDLNQTHQQNSSGKIQMVPEPNPPNTAELNRTYWKYPISPAPVQGVEIQGTNNGTINATYIYKLYQDAYVGKDVPQLAAPIGVGPQPELQVNYTVSSTEPNSIKILFIGMSPNPLKVGDIPQFTLTWQNISDKPVYQMFGDTVTPLGLAISPSDNVQIFPIEHSRTGSVKTHGPVYPGQIVTSVAGTGNISYDPYQLYAPGHYQIMKAGLLNMTMTIKLLKDAPDSLDLIEIIQFKVNATQ
jgi:hypothetical protein